MKGKNTVVVFIKLKRQGWGGGFSTIVTGNTLCLGHFLVLIAMSGYNVPCSKLIVFLSQF